MKIAVTGANGFVGKNLIQELKHQKYEVLPITRHTSEADVRQHLLEADTIVHLAGVNRPEHDAEFKAGNVDLLTSYLEIVKDNDKAPTIIMSSSIQASKDNPYGQSKAEGEAVLRDFSKRYGNEVYIYRLPNLFGKWCRPNYNSVIATFCHNIARDLDIQVNDPNVALSLNYIDDVIHEFIRAIEGFPNLEGGKPTVPNVHLERLGDIRDLLYKFKESRQTLRVSNLNKPFQKALYSTYLSYLPEDDFSYPLTMHTDERGSFTEFLKTKKHGQVSVNISKPGITKGNHWHHTKNEKFLVVSGKGVIRFRKPDEDAVHEYFVSGDKLEVVDIPVGYTHNIENLGDTDMVTIMWVNEIFDPENPDTYYLEV
ncbi:NAD-dependent epimerase/dehydratase family protein [Staphylococcus massiliensis]|uniref:polysaccharide biosynthesis C-terminal domain-containing protein n=1 Tax=Staphylococcus massiliensis TaxID=555791 RepID=UPI001EDC9D95|nr:NAD-dependent epimerase/dehydratase family protein [Staphylococcus massiliensis]MCG3411732.1 NAD-dependent epimerase/dehydratase family protein [Staphylococcus massiliensis]